MRRLVLHASHCRPRGVPKTVSRQTGALRFCSMGMGKVMGLGDGDGRSWRKKDPTRGGSGAHSGLVVDDEGPSKLSSASVGGDTRNVEHNSKIIMFGDVPVDLEATPNYPLFFSSSNSNEIPGKRRVAQQRDVVTESEKSTRHCEVRAATEAVREKELASYDTGAHRRKDAVVSFIKRRTRVDLRNQGTTRADSSNQVEKLHPSIGLNDARRSSGASNFVNKRKPFDICLPQRRQLDFAETSEHVEDCEHTRKAVQLVQQDSQVLRPGMVLLKSFITLREQIEIIRKCREIGIGPGGFYQPSYQDGAKLRLQMMCLGLDWDPNTRKYERKRQVDGCTAPDIPNEFVLAVKRAIGDAQDLVKKGYRSSNLSSDLPTLSPNICIVNFYTTTGRLGLHQDRDESRESLRKGLPVVSFSIGDSAEFLFGDYRDVDRAERVTLESGDVVIFGGESRMVYHGISSIIPNSTPKALLDGSGLRPGRLNLTFRQF